MSCDKCNQLIAELAKLSAWNADLETALEHVQERSGNYLRIAELEAEVERLRRYETYTIEQRDRAHEAEAEVERLRTELRTIAEDVPWDTDAVMLASKCRAAQRALDYKQEGE